ncbi:MAG: MCE family protein [Ignavibacteriae bacterium]|nr:MCE family protein [Ignavibacteriota bacterium]MCB0723441.1 MCE family protein [Ignavibacteriota bacterium]MCB9243287.1 MCE family protein [Ignavibacteriales bacterium]
MEKSKFIKLGFFVIAGLAAFIFAIFYIGNQQNLFGDNIIVYSDFKTVSGLGEGASVRYSGIDVGTVESVNITGVDKVTVGLRVKSSVTKFIKKDSQVIIASDGLVGNKIVQISQGTVSAKDIEDGDFLPSQEPVEINDVIENLNASSKHAEEIAQDIADIVDKVNQGKGTLGQLINNESLYNNVDSLMNSYASITGKINNIITKVSGTIDQVSTEFTTFSTSLRNITGDIEDITNKLNSSQSLVGTLLTDTAFANDIKGIIENTNATTYNLEQGSLGFYQNMEALKHNFLFKGYFEDLGYWDMNDFEQKMELKESMLRQREFEVEQKEKQLKELENALNKIKDKINQETEGVDSTKKK